MKILDPIEQSEARAERWADERILGENFVCDCGRQCKLENGVILSPDPNGIPVCPDCAMEDPAYAKWCADRPKLTG
jgi:hypothetical protein